MRATAQEVRSSEFIFLSPPSSVSRTLRSRAHTAAVWTGSPSAPIRTWTVTERAVPPSQLRTSPLRTMCGLNSTRTTRSLAKASGCLTSQVVQKINTAIYNTQIKEVHSRLGCVNVLQITSVLDLVSHIVCI